MFSFDENMYCNKQIFSVYLSGGPHIELSADHNTQPMSIKYAHPVRHLHMSEQCQWQQQQQQQKEQQQQYQVYKGTPSSMIIHIIRMCFPTGLITDLTRTINSLVMTLCRESHNMIHLPLMAVILLYNIPFIVDHISNLHAEWLAGSNRYTFK